MDFGSKEFWQEGPDEAGRYSLKLIRDTPWTPFTRAQVRLISTLPMHFSGDVEVAWSRHWGNEPTECTIVFNGLNDERFEEVREGLFSELDEAEAVAEIEAAPMEGDRSARLETKRLR